MFLKFVLSNSTSITNMIVFRSNSGHSDHSSIIIDEFRRNLQLCYSILWTHLRLNEWRTNMFSAAHGALDYYFTYEHIWSKVHEDSDLVTMGMTYHRRVSNQLCFYVYYKMDPTIWRAFIFPKSWFKCTRNDWKTASEYFVAHYGPLSNLSTI